ALRAEDDLLAVGRVAPLGVVAVGVGQAFQVGAVGVGLEDVHGRVEVPAVRPPLALLLLTQAGFLGPRLFCVGVGVAAGEDDLLAVGPEVGAGSLADAGADAAVGAAVEVHDEDLVERVAGVLLLGLEDDLLHVRREVALAGPDEILGELADVVQILRFG